MVPEPRGRKAGVSSLRRVRPLSRQAVTGTFPAQLPRPFPPRGGGEPGWYHGVFLSSSLYSFTGTGIFLLPFYGAGGAVP